MASAGTDDENNEPPFVRPLKEVAEQICVQFMFDGASLLRLGAVNSYWRSVLADEFVWNRINSARFGDEVLPPPAKPASALPGWSFFPGLDSPENDRASPEDAGADRSPAALARLADARRGVAFNTNGWVKRSLIPVWRWDKWTFEPGAGLWVRSSELEELRQQQAARHGRGAQMAWRPPAELPEQAAPPQARPPDFPGWLFYQAMDSPGHDIRPPHGGDSFRSICTTLDEVAARATALREAVAFNTDGYIKSALHSQSNWRRCTGPGGSSWAGLYVREEVVAARLLLRPLPGGGLDPRLRYFQRAKTRLLAARDVGVVWLNGEYLDRVPDPDLAGGAAGSGAGAGVDRQVVRLRSVCWLHLDGSFYGLGTGRYRALWSLRADGGGEGFRPQLPSVNFAITLSATRPHRPLEVFRSTAAADDDEGSEGAEGGGAARQRQQQGEVRAGQAGDGELAAVPTVGSELSAIRGVRLELTTGAWRDVSAGEFEVPPGAIFDVGVRLWNYDSGWKSGVLFKELRLVRLRPDGTQEEVEAAAGAGGHAAGARPGAPDRGCVVM
ncbi:hypothetical protein HXX76_015820 [Chlamydomonas incerta]|uniref:F-box domain-containing protein n=1 Tax=Chlamydomonas incerta TaxID=51695 RepID=A0A835SHW8_CHLIN|nr:hypothetical protein HXX76_015820 [Chlamydomonas incerta]|eukprot:KAG2422734.1 hypothetical protein HXX76_015820 [Chlamydomonas incerta]